MFSWRVSAPLQSMIEGGGFAGPHGEVVLGILDEVVERFLVLLHKAKEVNVHAALLVQRLAAVPVLLVHVLLVRGGVDQRHVHVEVVGELDRANELHELAAEVLHALRSHVRRP
jgi:hypothetical protein